MGGWRLEGGEGELASSRTQISPSCVADDSLDADGRLHAQRLS